MRLIDADALKEKAFFHEIDNVSYVEEEDIDKAPTINAVEVVLCKDCKNSDWYKSLDGKCLCYCMVHGKGGYTENDFCSRGERGEANNV